MLSSTEMNVQIEENHPNLSNKLLTVIDKHIEVLNENLQHAKFNEHSIKVLQNLASYLSYRGTNIALNSLEKLSVTLQHNIDVIKDPSVPFY